MQVRSSMITNLMHHMKVRNSKGAAEPPTVKTDDSAEPEAAAMPQAPHAERSSTAGEDVRGGLEEE